MSYFNHAYKKTFVATMPTQSGASVANVTNGILVQEGVHVSELKNQAAPYALGPGVVGLFDAATDLSALGATIGAKPFYIAAAAIKLNDKQGPFHGGYQESNKSKVINPKYLRKMWQVTGNAASPAIIEIGETAANTHLGGVLTFAVFTPAGTDYSDGTFPLVGGTGEYATATIVTDGSGEIQTVTIDNPGTGYTVGDVLTIADPNSSENVTVTVATIDDDMSDSPCNTAFYCGETYYLRVDVKGTAALRFANHNLYRTFDATGGCCTDPSNPVEIEAITIYKQWCEQIAVDDYLKDFVRPLLVADGQSYAFNAEDAVLFGLNPTTQLYSNAPASPTTVGMLLIGAYYDTTFANCTFQTSDYYGIEPIQIYASEVDLNGDPCTFESICVKERCPGIQANGTGESKVRDLILSESYLQNFMASDLRIREITQGTRAYEILDRETIYSSCYLLHSVPRYNNPTGVFDNDQYLLEIVGTADTLTTLKAQLDEIVTTAGTHIECENMSAITSCDFVIPTI